VQPHPERILSITSVALPLFVKVNVWVRVDSTFTFPKLCVVSEKIICGFLSHAAKSMTASDAMVKIFSFMVTPVNKIRFYHYKGKPELHTEDTSLMSCNSGTGLLRD